VAVAAEAAVATVGLPAEEVAAGVVLLLGGRCRAAGNGCEGCRATRRAPGPKLPDVDEDADGASGEVDATAANDALRAIAADDAVATVAAVDVAAVAVHDVPVDVARVCATVAVAIVAVAAAGRNCCCCYCCCCCCW